MSGTRKGLLYNSMENDVNVKNMPDTTGNEACAKSYEECKSYFKSKKGLANDFIFPGKELQNLKPSDRLEIEKKIIQACQQGDRRFFDALAYVRCFDLKDSFTGETVSKWISINDRIRLLDLLYRKTHSTVYLQNMMRLAGGDYYAAAMINELIKEDDPEENERWKTDGYQLFRHALKTIQLIRGSYAHRRIEASLVRIYKVKGYRKIEMLSSEEVSEMLDLDTWRFNGCDKAVKFYTALDWRYRYLDTKDKSYLKCIISDALIYPEVYDILRFMICKKEITQEQVTI